ncbi:acyltransferase [Komagataeibacter intermedius]|uniref:Acyltransferase n=2 Tax=Komagataeibacter intermedius TaxID=66229 RepID=A0A0N1F7S6_9PROT|nr:acyltransferase [Komagataeibacter intermedius]KPH85410.1 acyltransferase [Komagataeibacter intermedius AF2]MCF3637850.1 acyltransferase [Komagataeibacter intermedius]GAN88027.1 acyltransferase [Komagataeibacter intermedius TF2]GBQ71670.1 acyltransferase [Komagataeibacter intermedius NRIC 0521]
MLQLNPTPPAPSRWRAILENDFFPGNRRRDIDGLRGLAIALVVLFHAGWLKGGFIGVDVFVVISGYFMGRSALMQHPFQPVRFVCRRLYRLLPALLCMVALVSAGMLWWVLQSDRADIAINGAYALVYLSNIWASGHVGYFQGQAVAYPFLHTWSLSLEMQFYAIIFVMALLLPLTRHRRLVLSAIFSASAAYCAHAWYTGDSQAYYNIFDRLWQFALGTMVWMLPRPKLPAAAANAVYAAAVAVIVGAGLFYPLSSACPSWMTVFPCSAVVLIIMLPDTQVGRWCLVPLSPLGVISYSVYLWHWPGIVVANYLLFFQVHGAMMAGVLALVMVVSLLSYVLVERTGLDYEDRAPVAARNRGAALLVAACLGLAAVLAYISHVSRVH